MSSRGRFLPGPALSQGAAAEVLCSSVLSLITTWRCTDAEWLFLTWAKVTTCLQGTPADGDGPLASFSKHLLLICIFFFFTFCIWLHLHHKIQTRLSFHIHYYNPRPRLRHRFFGASDFQRPEPLCSLTPGRWGDGGWWSSVLQCVCVWVYMCVCQLLFPGHPLEAGPSVPHSPFSTLRETFCFLFLFFFFSKSNDKLSV